MLKIRKDLPLFLQEQQELTDIRILEMLLFYKAKDLKENN
jgi:hypothetical protein